MCARVTGRDSIGSSDVALSPVLIGLSLCLSVSFTVSVIASGGVRVERNSFLFGITLILRSWMTDHDATKKLTGSGRSSFISYEPRRKPLIRSRSTCGARSQGADTRPGELHHQTSSAGPRRSCRGRRCNGRVPAASVACLRSTGAYRISVKDHTSSGYECARGKCVCARCGEAPMPSA